MAHQSLSKDLEYDAAIIKPKLNERGNIDEAEIVDSAKIKDKVAKRQEIINKETQEKLKEKQAETRQVEEKDDKQVDENDLAL